MTDRVEHVMIYINNIFDCIEDADEVSAIISRKRDDAIGCCIRIPKDYVYEGWKTDFKTGKTKTIKFMEED